jgi:hypothetical protein
MSLRVVRRLSDLLISLGFHEFSLKHLERKIELIKTKFVGNAIYNPRFPINFCTQDGAALIAALMFDGGITSRLTPFYTNKEKFLIQKVINCAQRVVGKIDYNLRVTHESSPKEAFQVEFPRILGHILVSGLGFSPGKKIFTNPQIPDFIRDNPSLYKEFLRQAYDDEGYVDNPGSSGRAVTLTQYHSENIPPLRLLQVKDTLEALGIRTNGPYLVESKAKDSYTSYGWSLQITGQSDIEKFAQKVDFSLIRKRNELKKLLSSYQNARPRFKRKTACKEVLNACVELDRRGLKLTNKSIGQFIKRNPHYVSELASRLVKMGKLRVVQEARGSKGHVFKLIT